MKKYKILIFSTIIVLLFIISCSLQRDKVYNEVSTVEELDIFNMENAPLLIAIPGNSTLISAKLYIYVNIANNSVVNIHCITNDWNESTVTWNSFNGSYSSTIIASFVTDTTGWHSIDITPLVRDWINGLCPNYGILLDQADVTNNYSVYFSKENDVYAPFLWLNYTTPDGNESIETMPSDDSYIWELSANTNRGHSNVLYTGYIGSAEKQSLLKFPIEPKVESPGTGTPGYWKNHPDSWPTEEIIIGGITYSKIDAIEILGKPTKGDKTITMFKALVATKLNILIGNDSSCILNTVNQADIWMEFNPAESDVKAKSEEWKEGEPLYLELDIYNNGLLCAQIRE